MTNAEPSEAMRTDTERIDQISDWLAEGLEVDFFE